MIERLYGCTRSLANYGIVMFGLLTAPAGKIKLKVEWSSPVPFRWDKENDLIEVDPTSKIEELADLVGGAREKN